MALRTCVFRAAPGGNNLSAEDWHTIQAELEALIFADPVDGCGFSWNAEPWSSQLGEPCTCITAPDEIMQMIEADPRSIKVAEL